MDFFTSDWHLDHANIIKYSERPFKDVEHMGHTIVGNINDVIGPDDRLFNLGDLAFRDAEVSLRKWLSMITCKNIFVLLGNHDKPKLIRKIFTPDRVLPAEYEYTEGEYRLVLSHYAMRVWNHSHHGAGHLYGHSHGKLSPMVTSDGRGAAAFDIGVDCWDFKPLSLTQVKAVMKHRTSTQMVGKTNEIDDHHKPRS